MRAFLVLPALALVACDEPSAGTDIVGPFTGPVHRYVVDRFELPISNASARDAGDDLNGDGTIDNQLGAVLGTLAGEMDLTTHAADMLASGALLSSIEVVADDLDNDDSAGVRYVGAPDVAFTIMGGRIVGGAFTSNRTKTTYVPGEAQLILPVFVDADPVSVHAIGLELSYTRAAGGLAVHIAGGIDPTALVPAMLPAMQQMIAADPQAHMSFVSLFDANHDWKLGLDEIAHNSLLQALLAPDLQLHDASGTYQPGLHDTNPDTLSFGFTLHAIACDSGSCAGAIADPCHDRVRDGNETGVDCGGGCAACPGGEQCAVAADCQSQQCAGTCAAPSCSDGLLDGLETDRDCGSVCGGCADGKRCFSGFDCVSGHCSNNGSTYGVSGVCEPPAN